MMTDLSELRQELHKNPELSGKEFQTAKYITDFFKLNCPSASIHAIGRTSLLIKYQGAESAKPVAIRCELDALPIQEVSNFDYASVNKGVSHKCGHDGHMAIVAGLGLELQKERPKGDVYLLFQEAEEDGEGARKILEDDYFSKMCNAEYIFALHNVPGYPINSVYIKRGNFTPSVISAVITFKGKTSHAAEPQNGLNPAKSMAEIILKVDELQKKSTTSGHTRIIATIHGNIGSEDYGISAGSGQLGFTMRTNDNQDMRKLREEFSTLVDQICSSHEIYYELNWLQEFSSINNDNDAVQFIENAANGLNMPLVKRDQEFPWGEDFGLFTEEFKGAMFCIGAGIDSPNLHNPDYDFPDQITPSAIRLFQKIITDIQND